MKWLRTIWQKLARYGIPGDLPPAVRKKETIINQIVGLVILTSFAAAGVYLIGIQITPFPVAYFYSTLAMGVVLGLLLWARPKISLAWFKIGFYTSVLTEVSAIALFAGPAVNVHLILAGAILAPFIVVNKEERGLLGLAVVANILFTLAILVVFETLPPLFPMEGLALRLTQGVVFIFYLITILSYGLISWVETNQLEKYLAEEKEKSATLLRSILPAGVVEQLQTTGIARPQSYDSATVLFTDFVGFTKISGQMPPDRLVQELDLCFSYFDQVMRKYGLEKLKTIGDSYMAVGGIPRGNRTHPVDAVLAAIEMRNMMRFLREYRRDHDLPGWHIRIGIHTGPLVAGVIGQEKFAYDVWGATVNMASRMETFGKADQINISRKTWERVRYFFDGQKRANRYVKNLGFTDMFIIKGLRAKYLRFPDSHSPNQLFRKNYGRLARRGSRFPEVEKSRIPGPTGKIFNGGGSAPGD